VHWFGNPSTHSLQGNLHGSTHFELIKANPRLQTVHFPEAQVLQLSGHGLHELMVVTPPPVVVIASNPSAQL
jgi:hypothetical protein